MKAFRGPYFVDGSFFSMDQYKLVDLITCILIIFFLKITRRWFSNQHSHLRLGLDNFTWQQNQGGKTSPRGFAEGSSGVSMNIKFTSSP
jgi:hypothetical protein